MGLFHFAVLKRIIYILTAKDEKMQQLYFMM